MFDNFPVLAVCGRSGSGKTALIEKLIPAIRHKGLKVAVVKHGAHRVGVDCPGKDSDRFFQAGADVLLQGPQQELLRLHRGKQECLNETLSQLIRQYDLVLVEGHRDTELPKIWLLAQGEDVPPPQARNVLATVGRKVDRPEIVLDFVGKWLARKWTETPVFGCVLIGGASSRMGRPKHLLASNGRTWIENTVELLQQGSEQVVIVGAGEVPKAVGEFPRVADVPHARGPMAGLLAAMRWNPQVSWLVAACDLPVITLEAIRWLLATRSPGVWATLPRLPGADGVEPLLAHYDFRSRLLVERLAGAGEFSLNRLAVCPEVLSPRPPDGLAPAWQNINTPEQLACLNGPLSDDAHVQR